ncbi:twin-arginine translocase subunit TatC [Rhodocaloribacter litoris]|uniref:twin-arginine translocase subunit TatC n=1 Tax=Rhodocaloribacter litoris TaxID=2558931 RepID=UPI00141E1394|nr:twin-arginine translocase subunit TatC [Rhodocaloribacter litoris]QXD17039.1 twin-arginine translocase subunit TatC [Rhodocaloribacter litoris]GIV60048.1 MAG: Sec-independent protein translocase protein TatC [Rhodothermaceae bacterium]
MKRFGSRTAEKKLPPGMQGDGAARPVDAPGTADMAEMSFLEHLEELRWALIRGLGGILVATLVAVFFREWIIENILLGPKKPDFFMYKLFGIEAKEFVLQNRTITGQFFADIGTIVAVGAVLGSPLFVYSLWKFIEPGLYPHEKEGMRFASVFATVFFMLGIAFGYLVITPLALQFFAGYQISPEIENEFDINKYFSMVTFWSLGVGILFELPVVIYFLAKLGIATPAVLRRIRKYAIIVTLVLAAFFTPPDPISQILVALPLMLLYELSIYLAAVVERQRARALKKALE